MSDWTEARLQGLIDDRIEEDLFLEYKRAASLGRSDGRIREITKDVSAFANSSGGTLIYGIAESDDPDKRHLPEKIDPVNREEYSREWMDQIVNTIQPRIDGLSIAPVQLSTTDNHVVYVVEIPQSSTAHQARDKRYYKRYNFQSIPMEDFEVRDVMSRAKHPRLSLDFSIEKEIKVTRGILGQQSIKSDTRTLIIMAINEGTVFASYVNLFISIPLEILDDIVQMQVARNNEELETLEGVQYYTFLKENTTRDIVEYETTISGMSPKYGPSRFDPILPGLSRSWRINLMDELEPSEHSDLSIHWSIYADNAPKRDGAIHLSEIPAIQVGDPA